MQWVTAMLGYFYKVFRKLCVAKGLPPASRLMNQIKLSDSFRIFSLKAEKLRSCFYTIRKSILKVTYKVSATICLHFQKTLFGVLPSNPSGRPRAWWRQGWQSWDYWYKVEPNRYQWNRPRTNIYSFMNIGSKILISRDISYSLRTSIQWSRGFPQGQGG